MRNRKFPALIALLVAFAALTAGTAGADDTSDATVTATVDSTALNGTRIIESVPAVAIGTAAGVTVEGTLTAVIAEAAATGPAGGDWFVSASMTDLTNGTTTIPASAVAVSNRAVSSATALVSGVDAVAPTGSAALPGPVELFTTSGQATTSVYTNDYTSTSTLTLTPPDGTPDGTYTGTITVDLVE